MLSRTVELSPRKKKMSSYQETDFQSLFTSWYTNLPPSTRPFAINAGLIELKVKKNNEALGLSDFRPQQIPALLQVQTDEGIYKKLSDLDISIKPADCFFIFGGGGYIAVEFYKPSHPHSFYLLTVNQYLLNLNRKKKKSLREEEIQSFAQHFFLWSPLVRPKRGSTIQRLKSLSTYKGRPKRLK